MTEKLSNKNLVQRQWTQEDDTGPKKNHISIRISSELYRALKKEAEKTESSISTILRESALKEVRGDDCDRDSK